MGDSKIVEWRSTVVAFAGFEAFVRSIQSYFGKKGRSCFQFSRLFRLSFGDGRCIHIRTIRLRHMIRKGQRPYPQYIHSSPSAGFQSSREGIPPLPLGPGISYAYPQTAWGYPGYRPLGYGQNTKACASHGMTQFGYWDGRGHRHGSRSRHRSRSSSTGAYTYPPAPPQIQQVLRFESLVSFLGHRFLNDPTLPSPISPSSTLSHPRSGPGTDPNTQSRSRELVFKFSAFLLGGGWGPPLSCAAH